MTLLANADNYNINVSEVQYRLQHKHNFKTFQTKFRFIAQTYFIPERSKSQIDCAL